MTPLQTLIQLAYLVAAACFVLGLHQMNSPATARNGNLLSAAGMVVALGATAVLIVAGYGPVADVPPLAWLIIAAGVAVGGGLGLYSA
ncbi:MAG: NAD(P)(+) transhydrogenase (Re/Si-specific) subunit beta, partial [Candidatus Limnocylindrales bacterium]